MTIPAFTTLSNIQTKVRQIIAAGNSFQVSTQDINNKINSFYFYDFPAMFRSLKLKDKYTFNTIQGQDTYAFDSEHFTTVEMPCYCAKREIALFQDPWSFYGANFNWQNQDIITSGNGTVGPYSGITSAAPLIPSVNNTPSSLNYPASRVQNVLITYNTLTSTINLTDDGLGNLFVSTDTTATPIGSINYQTGVVTFTLLFPQQAIPQGNPVTIEYNPVVLSQPLSIMFFQNQFTLRPVPDKGYTIELIAYRQPTQALALTPGNAGTPELNEWWELIAFGTAKKYFEERMDTEGILLMDKILKERYDVAETRTYAQLGKQRINTLFSDQLQYNYGQGAGFFGSV